MFTLSTGVNWIEASKLPSSPMYAYDIELEFAFLADDFDFTKSIASTLD